MAKNEYYEIDVPDSVAAAAKDGAAGAEDSKSAESGEDEVGEQEDEGEAEAPESDEESATATVPLSLVGGEAPEVGTTVRFRVKAVSEEGVELEPLVSSKKDYEKEIDEMNED